MSETTEIPEAQADAETAALYRDIRACTGVGMVNLIYRHMAATPGLLPWAWGCLRPPFVSGRFRQAADAAVAEIDTTNAAPIPLPAFAVAGVGPHALDTIRFIVEAYNTGNSGNLFAMSALARFLEDGGAGHDPAAPDDAAAPPSQPPLPPILAMADMDEDTAALVREISAPVAAGERPIIPSLYRHLAPWPGVLALASASVFSPARMTAAKSDITTLHEHALASAEKTAATMAPPAGLPTPDVAALADLAKTAAAFARGPIATMVVLGAVLRAVLPDESIA
jgi:hypothetical protein